MRFSLVIDADDTLWENNIYFEAAFEEFVNFLAHSRLGPREIRAVLDEIESANSRIHGYGSLNFGSNLRQCYQGLAERQIRDTDMETVMGFAERILECPMEVIEGVPETLEYLAARHDLTLFTKGHPEEQRLKIERSGLGGFFAHAEIVKEKDAAAYRALALERGFDPGLSWMIGNSPKSDINPALEAGWNAVFVPHARTWTLERQEIEPREGRLLVVERFADLTRHFRAHPGVASRLEPEATKTQCHTGSHFRPCIPFSLKGGLCGMPLAMWMRTQNLRIAGLFAGTVLLCPAAFAQTASFGVVAGTNLTDGFGTQPLPIATPFANGALVYSSGPRNFIVGPKLEVRLPWGLSVEVDALHRNLQSSFQFVSSAAGVPASQPALRTRTPWEFPLLGKYRFSFGRLHPMVESGLSLRPAGTGTGLSHIGITAGAGAEMRVGSLYIEPALRFTHWAQEQYLGLPPARPDQVELFVGFGRSSSSLRPSAFGLRLSFGAIVGVGAGEDFRPAFSTFAVERPESNSPIAGASIETGISKRLSLEVNGMYRPLHATDVPVPGYAEGQTVRFATLTWEFPVLLKYRFSTPKARPFVELGPSFRAIGNVEIAPPSHYGITGGAGVEFDIARLKVSPTVRFTRWAPDGISDPNAAHAFLNQAQLLLGISF